ncbi:hypothetical protein A3A84_02135 [Candidatus Collierbacteria bacterium RIFCSPLOWO2_01_FULL_50_23]|uniref:Uncharacterized protein n=2 Tax=Candidatus Collieribacteriota TaxID=1752725 RepID=A0A1F5EQW0_9BACT|nr:MAG: hypothetical protein A3D09_04450 [Candidatus Collierbacteria bacterium RIFCSPHIGHO2_02_FULL_49_10]OGD71209.1 MAG: hypothetical protein A2703_02500 [Candidatus Collierbacteria bacterium RIFCSPHIGHO2_01_FULL_50_25]OGD73759.1 MAG: hypothetical protein A3A84_02135 [Candidatus Collierbacteria bacterium RIFCSPLOWO2_01_FULL_50_23]
MPKRPEDDVAPKEKKGKIKTPVVSVHLSFLKENALRYKNLTAEGQSEIERYFKEAFNRLPEEEQRAISLELQALDLEMGLVSNQNEGIAIVRQIEIVNRIREVMERGGVIASAKEGGLGRTRDRLGEDGGKAFAYLSEYETFARSVKDKSEDIRENAEYLLALVSGIKQELSRLDLVNVALSRSQGELRAERKARSPLDTSVSQFGRQLDHTIELEGLIGFSTLNNLIKEFHSAKRYLEDSVLRSD